MKKISKIVSAFVCLAMAVGVGVAIGSTGRDAEGVKAVDVGDLVYTLDGTITATGNAYATPTNLSQSSIDWSVTANTEQNPWRVGGKGLSNTDRAIYSKTAISENIAQIEVKSGATASSLSVNSLTISVHSSAADAASGSNAVDSKSVTSGIANSTVTFTKANSTSWAGCFYRIVYNVTRTSTSGNGYITFQSAKFYEEQAEVKTVSSVDVQTQPTKTEYKIGEAFNPAGLVVRVTYSDSTHDDVAYSSATASKFAFTGFDSSSATTGQEVTVKYTPVSDEFTCETKVEVDIIEVNPNAILVDASSVKKAYRISETLDLTDLVITVGFDDDSDEEYTITSNADFTSKGFTLKLSGSAFDLSTTLSMDHNGASFVVYYGELNDDTGTIDITVENVATITLNDASTTTFWSSTGGNSYDAERAGVAGNGTQYQAFEGGWYVNSGFQMNALDKGSYISNITTLGTIKTIVVSANNSNAGYFSMYYGTSANPDTNKITASVSSNTWTYDFSGKTATYFKLAKDVTKGAVVLSSIAITYAVNTSLDRTEAGAYADYFLATTDGLCDANGIENGVADVWAKLNGVFTLLSSTTKASLKAKAIAEAGEPDGTTVGNAMARYYWAVTNHAANTDFIGEGDISGARVSFNSFISNDDTFAITMIVIISIISLTAIGAFYFLRKRKEQ